MGQMYQTFLGFPHACSMQKSKTKTILFLALTKTVNTRSHALFIQCYVYQKYQLLHRKTFEVT